MIPTIGKIVTYRLTAQDADAINNRRKDAREKLPWHHAIRSGAQIHVGNDVKKGEIYPLIITKVWGKDETAAFNGQLLLDGNDLFWVTSTSFGTGEIGKCLPASDDRSSPAPSIGRRLGRFQISQYFLEDAQNLVSQILATVVVISVTEKSEGVREYLALSNDFDAIDDAEDPPMYQAGSVGDGIFTWWRGEPKLPPDRPIHQFQK